MMKESMLNKLTKALFDANHDDRIMLSHILQQYHILSTCDSPAHTHPHMDEYESKIHIHFYA